MKSPSDTIQLQQRNRELTILNDIARSLNQSVALEDTLQTTLAQVAQFFGLQTGWVWLLHEESGEPYLAAAQNLPPALTDNPKRMEGICYCLDTFLAGDMAGAANVNVVTCSRLKDLLSGTAGLRYHASIPLYAHGRKMGVLNVAGRDWQQLETSDLRLLHTVGDLLGIAIERAGLFRQSSQFGAVTERNRLAREIHDTLAQGLTAISLYLESADALLESGGDPGRVRKTLHQALQLTRANLEEARRSVLDLRAAPLEGRTLPQALTHLLQTIGNREELTIDFTTTGSNQPLPLRLEVGLFRIAQEAMNNIVGHAKAGRVKVELFITPQQVRLLIADDGIGFDPGRVTVNRYGLVGLNERAKLLGGTLHLQSSPGQGTRLEILIPLHEGHKTDNNHETNPKVRPV